jgi:hypothetical protein
VLVKITMAIKLHYKMFDVRRTNVEEAQVARAAFKRIADDLRCAVQYEPPNLAGLDAVTGNAAMAMAGSLAGAAGDLGGAAGGIGSGQGTGGSNQQGGQTNPMTGGQSSGGKSSGGQGQNGGGQGGAPMGNAGGSGGAAAGGLPALGGLTGAAAGEEEAAELGTPISVVGLYGSANQLQFDMSRLPRVDEYMSVVSAQSSLGVVDIPSDMKTVTYFVCSEDTFDAVQDPSLLTGAAEPSPSGRGRGLMRRELSRAVSSWAEANGNLSSTYGDSKLLAEEVVGLTFQYFDGTEWLPDWNSDDLGGLPKAVEITLILQPTYALSENRLDDDLDSVPPEQTFKLVVHLPAAQPGANLPVDMAADDGAVLEEAAMEGAP